MPIQAKRWNDPIEPGDGFRLLICRYRPRGLPKVEETWNAWEPDLGPSRELLAAYHTKTASPISWPDYRRRYIAEQRLNRDAIAALARRSKAGETITLLCSAACVREDRCHRSILKQLIEAVDSVG